MQPAMRKRANLEFLREIKEIGPEWIHFGFLRGFGYLFKCYVTACDNGWDWGKEKKPAQRTLVGEKIGQQGERDSGERKENRYN